VNADDLLKQKLHLPAGYTFKWAGEYEFELRAKERLQYLPSSSSSLRAPLHGFPVPSRNRQCYFPELYALTGGLILQKLLGYNFSVRCGSAIIALFGIAVETGVVMVVYLTKRSIGGSQRKATEA